MPTQRASLILAGRVQPHTIYKSHYPCDPLDQNLLIPLIHVADVTLSEVFSEGSPLLPVLRRCESLRSQLSVRQPDSRRRSVSKTPWFARHRAPTTAPPLPHPSSQDLITRSLTLHRRRAALPEAALQIGAVLAEASPRRHPGHPLRPGPTGLVSAAAAAAAGGQQVDSDSLTHIFLYFPSSPSSLHRPADLIQSRIPATRLPPTLPPPSSSSSCCRLFSNLLLICPTLQL